MLTLGQWCFDHAPEIFAGSMITTLVMTIAFAICTTKGW